jgi:hypothetical protein
MSQQSVLAAHVAPLALQVGVGAVHEPAVHALEQQLLEVVQLCPFSLQVVGVSHIPPTQSWLQQATLVAQVPPVAVHDGWAHEPPVQVLEQQSLAEAHA